MFGKQKQSYNVHDGIADAKVGGTHLAIWPHNTIYDKEAPVTSYEVHFFGDENGEVDTGNDLNSCIIDGTEDDLGEIADKYCRLLKDGVPVSEMFRDVEDSTRESMRELSQQFNHSHER